MLTMGNTWKNASPTRPNYIQNPQSPQTNNIQNNDLTTELATAYQTMISRANEHAEAMTQKQNEIDSYQYEIITLNAKISQHTHALIRLEKDLNNRDAKEEELKSQLQTLSTQKTADDVTITELKSELTKIQNELSSTQELLTTIKPTIQAHTELTAKLSETTKTLHSLQDHETTWNETKLKLTSQLQILSTQKTTDDSIITKLQLELAEAREELSVAQNLLKNRDHTIQSYADFRVMHRDCDHKRMIDSNKILRLDQEVTRLTNLLQETETTLNETQHQPLKLAENQDTLEDETPTIDDITDDTDNTDAISIPKPTAEFKNPTDNETPEPNEPTEHSQQEYNQNSNTNRTRDLGRAADFGVKYYISKNYRGSNPIQNYKHRPSTPPTDGWTQTHPNRQHPQPRQRYREYRDHHRNEYNYHNPEPQNTNENRNPPDPFTQDRSGYERLTKLENFMAQQMETLRMLVQFHLHSHQNQTNSDPNQQTHEEDQSNYANGSITRSSSQCSITE